MLQLKLACAASLVHGRMQHAHHRSPEHHCCFNGWLTAAAASTSACLCSIFRYMAASSICITHIPWSDFHLQQALQAQLKYFSSRSALCHILVAGAD